MGPAKVLLENNRVSNHERAAQGKLRACAHVIIDAAQLCFFNTRCYHKPGHFVCIVFMKTAAIVVVVFMKRYG